MAKKRHAKEGAIELSMTTVIVIILGVTLLTLGLVFVRGVFTKVGQLTEGAFEEADSALDNLGEPNQDLTLTSKSVELKQDGVKAVGILAANLGNNAANYQVRVAMPATTANDPDRKFECLIAETQSPQSEDIQLRSGDNEKFKLLISDENGPSGLGTYVCTVTLYKDGQREADEAVIITVK